MQLRLITTKSVKPQKKNTVPLRIKQNKVYEGSYHIRVKVTTSDSENINPNVAGKFLQEDDNSKQPHWELQMALILSFSASIYGRFEHSIELFKKLNTGEKLDGDHNHYAKQLIQKLKEAIEYAKKTWPHIFTEEFLSRINVKYGTLSKIEKLFNTELASHRSFFLREESIEHWLEDVKKIEVEFVKTSAPKPLMVPPSLLKRKKQPKTDPPENGKKLKMN